MFNLTFGQSTIPCLVVKKLCKNCSALNYAFSNECISCGVVFGKKDSGWLINTKTSDNYAVGTSGGRPSGNKTSDGYAVGTSGVRPSSTKLQMAMLSVVADRVVLKPLVGMLSVQVVPKPLMAMLSVVADQVVPKHLTSMLSLVADQLVPKPLMGTLLAIVVVRGGVKQSAFGESIKLTSEWDL